MEEQTVKQEIRSLLWEKLDFSKDWSDEEIASEIEKRVLAAGKEEYLSLAAKQRLCQEIFNSLRRLDVLQELLDDPEITEIMVNGPEHIFIERGGKLFAWEKQIESEERLEDIIQQIVSKVNRVVNEAHPIVDARLADGSRINAVLPPIALDGAVLTIRKFSAVPYDMERLVGQGSVSREAADCLKYLVQAGYNILICGGTGSGKTTFLNALSGFIPKKERVITIEDSAELQIQGLTNLVRLEIRNENVEGKGAVTMRELIKAALRMRPNRIVIGEVRDGGAALDMLIALNTGHDGSLTTLHSNSAKEGISRLETLVLTGTDMPLAAIRRQIASALDLIIYLGRLRDKSRRVLEIVEVCDYEEGEVSLNPLFQFQEEPREERKASEKNFHGEEELRVSGRLLPTGNRLQNRDKLIRMGVMDEEISI